MPLDEPVRQLLDGRNFAHVATIKKDGSPYVIPVWVTTDGEHVIVNSSEGRNWPAHLERDPRTTVTVMNMENPYEYATIFGQVAERTHDDGVEVINALAKKYMDLDEYPFFQEGEQRVTIRIAPDKVVHRRPG